MKILPAPAMKTYGIARCWLGLMGWLGVLGTIGLVLTSRAVAQSLIVPDNTLGAESSQVIQNFNGQPTEVIINGAQRGQNLFHSFREFNISAGRSALFLSPSAEIRNILTRVTGNNPSDIGGILGAFEIVGNNFAPTTANLFLINPNGIIFSAGARLNVGGSFVATTADAIQFDNQGFFGTTNPGVPPLLTIAPSAFLFNQIAAQPILNQSRVTNPSVPSFIDGLRVNDGQSLLLLGGNVTFDGGTAQARGGRIEIGGLTGSGKVDLTVDGNNLDLNFPGNATLANIALTNGSRLETSGIANSEILVGGEIQTHSTNLILANNSNIRSDTFGAQNGGDISLQASQVELRDRSNINAYTSGSGSGGNIEVGADVLRIQNSSQIGTGSIFGTGSGGRIVVQAKQSVDLLNSSLIGSLSVGRGDQTGSGNAGSIFVHTRNLNIQSGSSILSSTFIGDGNAGSIDIHAANVNLNNSIIFTSSFGIGAGGDISINTGTLSLKDGSGVQTSAVDVNTADFNALDPRVYTPDVAALVIALRGTVPPGRLGQANSGNLSVEATNFVEVVGTSTSGGTRSQLSTGTSGSGSGGELSISTGSLRIAEGGLVNSSSSGSGRGGKLTVNAINSIDIIGISANRELRSTLASLATSTGVAGDVTLTTDRLRIQDGGVVSTSTFSQGHGGNLDITARESTELVGTATFADGSTFSSGLLTGTFSTGTAGTLRLETGRLAIREGGQTLSSTAGAGQAGDATITADLIELVGISTNQLRTSGIVSQSDFGATGDAGNVTVSTRTLSIRDGARISTATFGQGRGGNLNVTAHESTDLAGIAILADGTPFSSGLSAATSGGGAAGTLQLFTRSLKIQDGAGISAFASGSGIGGDINIVVDKTLRMNTGFISSASSFSEGGDINITARDIRLQGNSNIVTSVLSGAGGGGDINLTARSIIALDDSDILAFARDGRGGNVTLNTRAFFGQNYRPAPPGTDPLTLEDNNRVDVNASGTVSGVITIPDTTFIQNSLTQLSDNLTDPNTLLANSCIVRSRSREQNGTFLITGSGGLPIRPGDPPPSSFPTGEVRSLPQSQSQTDRPWKLGDPIVEPQGVYRLANGKLVMSRECER